MMVEGSQVEKIIRSGVSPAHSLATLTNGKKGAFNYHTSHTILLTQPSRNKASRSYSDHETIALAVEEVIKSYEAKLKEMNPTVRDITYDIKDLYNFVDHFADIGILVYDNRVKAYLPHDREWLKARILSHLQRAAK